MDNHNRAIATCPLHPASTTLRSSEVSTDNNNGDEARGIPALSPRGEQERDALSHPVKRTSSQCAGQSSHSVNRVRAQEENVP
jgi:hypothetical protein